MDDLMNKFKWDLERFLYPVSQGRTPMKRILTNEDYIPLDVADEGDHFSIHAELPGVNKEDVEVDLDDETMTISVKREESKEQKDKDYFLRERHSFSSKRTIELPDEVLGEKAKGKMENGVLWINIPKKNPTEKKKPRKVAIE
jgi:HSP20 family protein